MEEDEERVQENGGQNGQNILRINTFYEARNECLIFGHSTILEGLIIFT